MEEKVHEIWVGGVLEREVRIRTKEMKRKGNERGGGTEKKIRNKEKDRKRANGFRKRKAVKGQGNGI
jgi:hypothetical protein